MLNTILKIPLLRLKYRFFPNSGQKFWQQELLNSQGLSAKIGQVLTQGKQTEMPKASIKKAKAEKLFYDHFKTEIKFSDEALAASIGQVFLGRVEDKAVAVKILHPNIKKTIKNEINNVLLLGKYYGKLKGFEFKSNIFEIFLREVFEQETDLEREADFQEKFYRIFSESQTITIPAVYRNYSNKDLLTQDNKTCVLARDLNEIENFHIFNFFFEALFNHGILHGDLNDRNWGINDRDQVVVYDYGCSHIISSRRINGLLKLIKNEDLVNAFKEFGVRLEATYFKGKEQELRDGLFAPLFDHFIAPDLAYSENLKNKFGDEIKKLREFSDPWVLLLMRSLFSLIRVYQDRKISIPLNTLLIPYLESKVNSMSSTQIHIQVTEGNQEVVSLRLPMTALENLSDLMPDKVAQKIHEQGLDLAKISENVVASGFKPQDLFKMEMNNRSYRVWIA
jgi:predicted unusual protein kinase regulating ubiquinone biosynthesis (AarF/ABC1/UbiB family)